MSPTYTPLSLEMVNSKFGNRRKPRKVGGDGEEEDVDVQGTCAISTFFFTCSHKQHD